MCSFKEVIVTFSCEILVFIIKRYFETKSYKIIPESFKEKFGDEETLEYSTIKRIIEHFEVHFLLESTLCSERPMVRTEEKREEVCQQIIATPWVSVCKLAQCVPTLSCTSVYRTLKDLHFHLCTNETKVKTDRPGKMSKFLQWAFEIYTLWNKFNGQHFFYWQSMGAKVVLY